MARFSTQSTQSNRRRAALRATLVTLVVIAGTTYSAEPARCQDTDAPKSLSNPFATPVAAELPAATPAAAAIDTAAPPESTGQSTPPLATPPVQPPASESAPAVDSGAPSAAPATAEAPQLPPPDAPAVGTTKSPGELPNPASPFAFLDGMGGPDKWASPEGISSSLKVMALLAVVSLAPAILMMTTCFVRIVVVLGLLRQALGTQQLPPNQVMTGLALFMTLLVMSPVWTRVYNDAVLPYSNHELTLTEAWDAGVKPVRQFMSAQIDRTGNRDDVWLFYKYLPEGTPAPSSYDDVPLTVLLPAFMLSELKTAFLIGFQIYLPFLVLDLVVSSVTISMGMLMLPPTLVSLPFKLLLFVLVDGWHLVVGMLLESFQTFT